MNTFLWMCIIAIIHGTILDDADVAEVLRLFGSLGSWSVSALIEDMTN